MCRFNGGTKNKSPAVETVDREFPWQATLTARHCRQDKGQAGVTPHGLLPRLSRSSQDSVAAETSASAGQGVPAPGQKETRRVETAGFLRITPAAALGALRDCPRHYTKGG